MKEMRRQEDGNNPLVTGAHLAEPDATLCYRSLSLVTRSPSVHSSRISTHYIVHVFLWKHLNMSCPSDFS